MKKFKKGFTLIELLVVIAIIGILTAIIIPNLSVSRQKAKVASFQAEMDSFKKAAELFFSNGNTYIGLFDITASPETIDIATADPVVKDILTALALKSADTFMYGLVSGNNYAVYGRLPGTLVDTVALADIWCVDNLGKSGNPSADATVGAGGQFDTAVAECW